MLGQKTPIFFNMCTGAIGSYIGTVEEKSERDHVKVVYVPLNAFRAVKTEESYPKEHIIRTAPDNINIPGVFKDYVLVVEDNSGKAQFLDKVREDVFKKITRLKEESMSKELELKQQKYRAREAKEESSKQLAKELELTERNKRREKDLFYGVGRGRYSSNLRNYMYDEDDYEY